MRQRFIAATVFGVLFVLLISIQLNMPAAAASLTSAPLVTNTSEAIGGQNYEVSRVTVNAPPEQVQSVLNDYSRADQVYSNIKKCVVVEDKGAEKSVFFSVKALGNMCTFDYVLKITEEPGYIEWHRQSGAFKKNEGFWRLEALDGGRSTLVTYAKYIDGGMFIPQSMINKELRAVMPVVMGNLKNISEFSATLARADGHQLR